MPATNSPRSEGGPVQAEAGNGGPVGNRETRDENVGDRRGRRCLAGWHQAAPLGQGKYRQQFVSRHRPHAMSVRDCLTLELPCFHNHQPHRIFFDFFMFETLHSPFSRSGAHANCCRSCFEDGDLESSGKCSLENQYISPLPVSISPRPSGTRRTSGQTRRWESEPPERSRSSSRNCGRRHLPGCYPCGGQPILEYGTVFSEGFLRRFPIYDR